MLSLIRTKACGRCGGDISLECDIYGVFVQCIQCGATWNDKDLVTAHTRATKSEAAVLLQAVSQNTRKD
jgi:hypothetical protein